jgi:2-oxoglutarate ferredoxin oxidoreductase subunit beta
MRTKASPRGVPERPFDPVALAIVSGASFVARGFSGKPGELSQVIEKAFGHKGFAFVHVLSPCTTFHDTYEYYRTRVTGTGDHDVSNKDGALRLAMNSDGFPLGVYLDIEDETFDGKVHSFKSANGKDLRELIASFS